MKKRLLAALVIVAVVVGTVAVYAQGPGIASLPGSGWWVATQVMNVGSDTAQVTFHPVLGLGVSGSLSAADASTTIAQNASKTFMPEMGDVPLTMDAGFKGSAVVSSDQPVVAIGAIQNNDIGGVIGVVGGRAAAQYPGIGGDAVATTVVFPLVKNDFRGKMTTFYVQTVQAGKVDAVYSMNNGANQYPDSKTTTIDGQMATFSPDDVAGMPKGCSDATCLGAVAFSSSVPLAGVYVESNTTDSPAQILLSTRGFTPADFDTTVVMPNVKSLWKGRTTGVQIANVGTAASTISVTLSYQAGSASSADGKTVVFSSVAQGASVTYFPGNHTAQDTLKGPFGGGPADEFLGAATITSDQSMVAICNENDFAGASTTKQSVYAGFPQKSGTSTVLFPLVKEFYKKNQTGLQIMNVGADPITLSAEYVFSTGTFTVNETASKTPITVQPKAAFTFWGVTDFWSGTYDGYKGGFGAVTVSATGSGQTLIVGIAQEAEYPSGGVGFLDTKNYEGFNQ